MRNTCSKRRTTVPTGWSKTVLAARRRNFVPVKRFHFPVGHRENRVVRARLEIDVETKVIRRLVVRRWSRGGTYPRRLVTTTYTLVGSEARSDLCYQPEGHLDEPFVIYTREHEPEKRFEILSRLYGLRLPQNQP